MNPNLIVLSGLCALFAYAVFTFSIYGAVSELPDGGA